MENVNLVLLPIFPDNVLITEKLASFLNEREKTMELTINGEKVSIEPQPGEMLADLLRERLNLTGTKIGCNEAECGSCTVLIDGEPVLSCAYPSAKAAGKNILTIEGLAGQTAEKQDNMRSDDQKVKADIALHPLQEAFINHGAVQCGFCIPGQLMTAYAL
ncbi:MAG: (2Fe-2S)-binding protein, partial [Anaerolineales bacterium]